MEFKVKQVNKKITIKYIPPTIVPCFISRHQDTCKICGKMGLVDLNYGCYGCFSKKVDMDELLKGTKNIKF